MICINDNESDIMTVDGLMEYLSIGKTTAYKLLKSGKIKVVRIGKLYRIPKKSVDEYIEKSRNQLKLEAIEH